MLFLWRKLPLPHSSLALSEHPHSNAGRRAGGRCAHCLPTYRASHHASMVLSRILIATPYNDSKTVRRPAPRDHPPAFSRHRLPLAPETCTTFTRGCMSSGPRSTRSQRLPRACSDFIRGSGLVGRTVWKVMMAHLEYELRSRPVRAMWDDFDAIVAGHSGR